MVIRINNKAIIEMRNVASRTYHWNDGITILKVIRGRITVTAWANVNNLNEGDFIVINSGSVHNYCAGSRINIIGMIHMSKEYLIETVPYFKDIAIICNSLKYRHHNEKKYEELNNRLDELFRQCFCHNQGERCIEEKMDRLLHYLVVNFDYVSCGIRLNRFSPKIVERYKLLYRMVYFENQSIEMVSLKRLSILIAVDYNYLRRDFVTKYGCGYKQLLYGLLVERASKRLLMSDESITSIGLQCGFSDSKYMVQKFKKYFNCTPTEFRKKNKDTLDIDHDDIISRHIVL